MKKKLLRIMGVALLAIAGFTATQALFSDVEQASGTFVAGSLNIDIESIEHAYTGQGEAPDQPEFTVDENTLAFTLDDIKPIDSGTVTYEITNTGNPAFICAMVEGGDELENGINSAEAFAGDVTEDEGELGKYMSFMFGSSSGRLTDITGQWFDVGPGAVASGATVGSTISYCFGDYDGSTCVDNPEDNNDAQTDSLEINFTFQAIQTRNNAGFSCSDLNTNGEEPTDPIWTTDGTQVGGAVSFIDDEDAPLGERVLQLVTINDVNSRVRYSRQYSLGLDEVTAAASFQSKQVSAADTVHGNASFRFIVDLDGNLGTTGDVVQLTYEPYYNIAAHNDLNDAAIVPGVWQTWNITQTKGKFWSNGVLSSIGGGGYDTNFTLAELLAVYPDAEVVGLSVGMGTYNVDQVVHVDELIVNAVVLGFEDFE